MPRDILSACTKERKQIFHYFAENDKKCVKFTRDTGPSMDDKFDGPVVRVDDNDMIDTNASMFNVSSYISYKCNIIQIKIAMNKGLCKTVIQNNKCKYAYKCFSWLPAHLTQEI